jgi:hypothetical protein
MCDRPERQSAKTVQRIAWDTDGLDVSDNLLAGLFVVFHIIPSSVTIMSTKHSLSINAIWALRR